SSSVHALKTSSRGASNVRVMTSTRSSLASTGASFRATMFLLLSLDLLEVFVEAVETFLPEFAVMLDPVGDVLEGRRVKPARTPLRRAPARDQPRPLQ